MNSFINNYGDKIMPVAIVGVAGRFPGDASDPDKLWSLLTQGRSARSKVPEDRYNVDAHYHPHAERLGAQNFTTGHFMHRDPAAFDAPFFQITPNEAKALDPQQRMLLEVAYEALENAGIPMERVVKSPTSCYVGCFTRDYGDILAHDVQTTPAYSPTGASASCLSNRVSWFYDLRGPSMTVDTACSSSLVALHLACQSLRDGESEMSLVGGVNFMCSPDCNNSMSSLHFLSPDGKCQSFDEKGNGYARGEGTSFVIIKPLAAAIRDNDVIRAVIRGTGSNQDGLTPGLTLPSSEAQAQLIQSTYERAGLSLADTGYVEAHGTGTAAGDPIETSALGATLGKARQRDRPLWVGSIKANIGHLEGASGIAGLVKAIYILEQALIPPQIWLDRLNPRILADEWNLAFPRKLTAWPYDGLRRISINSFGFGGANAHCILDDAYHYLHQRSLGGNHNTKINHQEVRPILHRHTKSFDSVISDAMWPKPSQATPCLTILSSHEQSGMSRLVEVYRGYLETKMRTPESAEDQADMYSRFAYTLGTRRSVLAWKSYFVAATFDQAYDSISEMSKPVRSTKPPKLGFVFTGQGAQHFEMGRELYAYQVYARSLEDADAYLRSMGCEWSVIEELFKASEVSNVDKPDFSQPLCTALQIGLVDLMRHWNILPAAVVGHSSGEIAAAYAKGAITREDAWRISYHRGRLSAKLDEIAPDLRGAMLAAGLDAKAARKYIDEVRRGRATIACVNSPSNVTISGDESAICEIEEQLKADEIFARRLKVKTAYHSFHMEAVSQLYLEALEGLSPSSEDAEMPMMFSSVTGSLIRSHELGPQYWVDNMLRTVKFAEAVESLLTYTKSKRVRAGSKPYVDVLVEVGPHGALQAPIKQCLGEKAKMCTSLSVLTRGRNSATAALEMAGALFQLGANVDIGAVNSPDWKPKRQQILIDLPPYPWNHENKYWHQSAVEAAHRFRKLPRNDLLGTLSTELNRDEPSWRHFIRLSENPWVEDHMVQSTLLYPAAGMMAMAVEAAAQIADHNKGGVEGYELKDVLVDKALIVPRDEDGVEAQFHLRPWRMGSQATTSAWHEFTIYSRSGNEEWSLNCSGLLRVVYQGSAPNATFADETRLESSEHRAAYERAKEAATTHENAAHFYDRHQKLGLQYGPTFRNLFDIWKGDQTSSCLLRVPDVAETMPMQYLTPHRIHPTTLDTLIQTLMPTVEGTYQNIETAAVPTFIQRLYVSADCPSEPGTVLQTYSVAGYSGLKEAEASVYASIEGWAKPLVILERIRATRISAMTSTIGNAASSNANLRKIAGELIWERLASAMSAEQITTYCRGPGKRSANAQLAAYLRLLGHETPGQKILEIGCQSVAVSEAALGLLVSSGDSTPWFRSYDCVGDWAKAPQDVAALIEAHSQHMSYNQLDISGDLAAQGFDQGEYDVIIISDCNEISDLPTALRNAKSMLRPGGKLVVGDQMVNAALGPAINGTIEHESDSNLDKKAWNDHLREAGFEGVDRMLVDDSSAEPLVSVYTIATFKPLAPSLPDQILIVEPLARGGLSNQALSDQLADQLRSMGSNVSTVELKDVAKLDLADKSCIVMIELESPLLYGLEPHDFEAIQTMLLTSSSVTWIAQGGAIECNDPRSALITGLARTLRQEHTGIKLATLDLPVTLELDSVMNVEAIIQVVKTHSLDTFDQEFALRDGVLRIPRLDVNKGANDLIATFHSEPVPEPGLFRQTDRALTLSVKVPGMLDSLYFKDDETWVLPLEANDIEIEVMASGLNFMDVMVAMDQIQEPAIGVECAGVVSRVGSEARKYKVGDRLICWRLGAFSNFVRNHEMMFQPIPDGMSFETAASIPAVYCSAYSALIEEARLSSEDTILIHAAAGGVGQAAIQIAQHIGATVYATVGSQAKKDHIVNTYGVPEDHIFNSRDLSFAAGIKRMTSGKGVDVVLNSLAGEALRESWNCLAWFGRFVELGKKDITGNTGLEMAPFIKHISFHSVNVIGMQRVNMPRAARLFHNTMLFFRQSNCQPVSPIQAMGFDEVESGFRLLQSGKHMGKIVFKAGSSQMIQCIPRKVREAQFDPNATYILSGGLGGLGRSLSTFMVSHGAKNLAFISRSGAAKPEAQSIIDTLASQGVHARAYACDIGDSIKTQETLATIQAEMPKVRGIIQAAMSLADSAFANMTHAQWNLSVNPKAPGTWNLHQHGPKDLDFFIMLSSSSGIAGTRGQGNYAAGNTFQDALAHYRRAKGMYTVAVDVGPVSGAGHAFEHPEILESLSAQGYVPLLESEFLALIQAAVTGETASGRTMPAQLVTGFITGGILQSEGREMPFYLDDPKFHHVRLVDARSHDSIDANNSFGSQLPTAQNLTEAAEIVTAALAQKLAKLMMVSDEDIDTGKPISTYGVDSLTAVEIRAWTFRELQSDVSIFDVMSNVPISNLARTIASKSKLVSVEVVAADM